MKTAKNNMSYNQAYSCGLSGSAFVRHYIPGEGFDSENFECRFRVIKDGGDIYCKHDGEICPVFLEALAEILRMPRLPPVKKEIADIISL